MIRKVGMAQATFDANRAANQAFHGVQRQTAPVSTPDRSFDIEGHLSATNRSNTPHRHTQYPGYRHGI